jgi:predicted TIM-barrel fold metal-dependent hydrolase
MLRSIGLKVRGLDDPAFDQSYVDLLRDMLEEAPLDGIGLLAQDHVYHADGRRMENIEAFYVPNAYLFDVCEAHPGFLPVVSIHPARADALEELDRCLKRGAVMLKLLPNCHNVNPAEPGYQAFWRRMAEAGLPLLAHTGSEYTLPVVAPGLQDPRMLEPVLDAGVTVIAAHAATSSSPFSPDYFTELVEMMRRHPNLYADTSAWASGLRGRHAARCVGSEIESRLVHGSDFPVPVQLLPALLQGQIDWSDFLRLRKRRGALARDAELKRSVGFKDDHFTRLQHLLRLPENRDQ